jgi:hypothetical protein
VRSGEPELEGVLDILILRLEVLGRKEHSLRPDNAMPVPHGR